MPENEEPPPPRPQPGPSSPPAPSDCCDPALLAQALTGLGCPAEKAPVLAAQLDKRARQLAASQGRTYADSLAHLLGLMRQGWAARENKT